MSLCHTREPPFSLLAFSPLLLPPPQVHSEEGHVRINLEGGSLPSRKRVLPEIDSTGIFAGTSWPPEVWENKFLLINPACAILPWQKPYEMTDTPLEVSEGAWLWQTLDFWLQVNTIMKQYSLFVIRSLRVWYFGMATPGSYTGS